MKIKIIITFLLIGIGQNLFAYPITPRPLRKLVLESEFIVYADVIKIETIESDDNWNDTKAVMVIREILQGKMKKDTIDVFFTPGMICPSPARYEKGTTVLAFLDKQKKGYSTHALSYGSKTVDSIAFEVYKNRINEMQNILTLKSESEKNEKIINWLISCAVNPSTRWEGIYELSPQSDFMSYYDQDKKTFVRKYELNENQKIRLRKAFFEIKNLSYSDMGLIDLIVKKNDTELINFLIKELKESDIEKMWYKDFLMVRVAEFTDRDDLRKIIKEMEELDYMDKRRDEKSNQLAKEFIEKI
jgi:hypothetical protein